MLSHSVWGARSARLGAICLGVLLVAACASCPPAGNTAQSVVPPPPAPPAVESSVSVVPPPPIVENSASVFPPQRVMESSEYAKFLAENRRTLAQCKQSTGCEVALFNLGFVHAYPQSPYYDPTRALQYFDELLKKYPRTSWAYESRAWRALINENLALEGKRRRLEAEFRARDDTVRNLQMQLDRARDIDIEYDKKKLELSR
jgi:hypothetical protein